MSKVEFKCIGGPFGDCTSSYDVTTDAKNVGEFIDIIKKKDNFATFVLRASEGLSIGDVAVAKAEHGEIVRKASLFEQLALMKPKEIKANGGYGNINYDIQVEEKLPPQNRKEYELIYWGFNF